MAEMGLTYAISTVNWILEIFIRNYFLALFTDFEIKKIFI